ncbi:hypothetical protein KI387_024853 [Taxus chinensis]|uniref:RING-type E3 ubiquitin transferase n=1 Tax=Taxus chinensis TaxID=29808 RepID=A0AA38G486_TAXCH|nr:hypothetical protein KI387_024853 [Taxus chinensis]
MSMVSRKMESFVGEIFPNSNLSSVTPLKVGSLGDDKSNDNSYQNYNGTYNVNLRFNPPSAIIIIALFCLFFFIGVSFIFMRRRCISRGTRIEGSSNNVRVTAKEGLDIMVVESLPVISHNLVKGLKTGSECAVCLTDFEEKIMVRLLPKCSHAFHPQCIDMWLFSHNTCPVCRTSLLPSATGADLRVPDPQTTGEQGTSHHPDLSGYLSVHIRLVLGKMENFVALSPAYTGSFPLASNLSFVPPLKIVSLARNNSSDKSYQNYNSTDNLNNRFDPLSAIIIIGMLCFLFFFGFLFIFLWHCTTRRASRAVGATNNEPVAATGGAGLDKTVVDSFQVYRYNLVEGVQTKSMGSECAVCLAEFEEEMMVRVLPVCGHAFHLDCIDMWLSSHTTCPMCRSSLLPAEEQVTVVIDKYLD